MKKYLAEKKVSKSRKIANHPLPVYFCRTGFRFYFKTFFEL